MSILLVDDSDGVRTLTLNRPERKNALSPELVQTMEDALKAADADSAVRCIVLTGAGEGDKAAFCAGGDLAGGMTGDGFFEQHLARGAFAELLLTMHRLRTPTIAAVNGHALGGGFGLVLACDLAVAADDARLGTPEVKRGLFPMMISALIDEVLPRKPRPPRPPRCRRRRSQDHGPQRRRHVASGAGAGQAGHHLAAGHAV